MGTTGMVLRRLVFFPDYSADPLWDLCGGAMVSLDALAVSVALRREVRAWAAEWERLAYRDMRAVDVALGEHDGPADAVTAEEDAANQQRGRLVWQQLRAALAPDVLVGWASFEAERRVQWDPDGPYEAWPVS